MPLGALRLSSVLLLVLGVGAVVVGVRLLAGGPDARPGEAVPAPEPAVAPQRPVEGASPGSRLEVSAPRAAGSGTFVPRDDLAAPEAGRASSAHPERAPFVPGAVRLAGTGTAAVDRVATGADGVLALPEDPRRMGWWTGGSDAGAPWGSVVLAGHLDSRTRGLGFAAGLADLARGDRVVVGDDDQQQAYVVRRRYLLPRERVADLVSLFSGRSRPRLVLLTCGGDYDPARGYSDNLVVEALPVGAPHRAASMVAP